MSRKTQASASSLESLERFREELDSVGATYDDVVKHLFIALRRVSALRGEVQFLEVRLGIKTKGNTLDVP